PRPRRPARRRQPGARERRHRLGAAHTPRGHAAGRARRLARTRRGRCRGVITQLAAQQGRGYPFRFMELQHRTLEQLLLEDGRVGADDLRKIKRLQQERGERLERLLLDLGFISEEDLLPLLSDYLGVPTVTRKDFPEVPVPLGSLNLKFLRHAKV